MKLFRVRVTSGSMIPTIKIILIQDFIKTLDQILLKAKEKPRRGRRKQTEEKKVETA